MVDYRNEKFITFVQAELADEGFLTYIAGFGGLGHTIEEALNDLVVDMLGAIIGQGATVIQASLRDVTVQLGVEEFHFRLRWPHAYNREMLEIMLCAFWPIVDVDAEYQPSLELDIRDET